MNIGWLKFWIGVGVVSAIATTVLPPLLVYRASEDVKRYRECVEGKRRDCDRSMVWNLVDAAALFEQQSGTATGDALGLDLFGARAGGAMRTSENAPFIEKVEPKGMSNADGVYRANVGAEVTFRVTVTGLVTSVELYQVEGEDGRPAKAATFKKGADGVWQASYALPPGFKGTIEVRAYGEDPKDIAALALPVAAN